MPDSPIPLNDKVTIQSSDTSITKLLDFPAYSAQITNSNNQWLHFIGTDQFSPPGASGQIVSLMGLVYAELEWAAPPGAVQGPAAPGTGAKIVYYSIWMPPYPGLGGTFQSVPKPYDGQTFHAPVAGVRATCSLPGTAGRRWVCATLTASLAQTAAAALLQEATLLDGPSGAPDILYSAALGVDGVAGHIDRVALSGLAYFGSAGRAMTLEFAAAGAGVYERVTFGAYLV